MTQSTILRNLGLFLLAALLLAGTAAAAPPVTWDSNRLEVEIGDGPAEPVEITFQTSRDLHDVTLEVVPELAPFISIENGWIEVVEAGTDQVVHLSFYLPPETPERTFDGVLKVRQGRRTIPRPLPIELTVDYGDNVVAPGTVVLDRPTARWLTGVSPDGRRLSFDTRALDGLSDVAAGVVLVVPPADELTSGFLGRVTGVEQAGGEIFVETVPAALTEALSNADLSHVFQLGSDDVVGESLYAALTVSTAYDMALVEPIELPVDLLLYDLDGDPGTTNDQARAVGGLTVQPEIEIDFDIDDGEVTEFSFLTTTSAVAELALEAEIAATLETEAELADLRFRPLVVWAGWVPVVLQPRLTFTVGASAAASATFEAGVRTEATVGAGIVYDGVDWSTAQERTLEFTAIGPEVQAGVELEAHAGPDVALLLYGVVGPQVGLTGALGLSAEPGSCPHWWELTAGLELAASLDMGPFSDVVEAPEFPPFFSVEEILAHAGDCGDPGEPEFEERIFFASDRGGDRDIWSVDPTGGDLRAEVSKPGLQSHPAISPDGTHLAYLDGVLDRWVVMDLISGDETVLSSGNPSPNFDWSADGTAIVGSEGSCSNSIRRYPLTGGSTLVVNDSGRDTMWAVDWTTGEVFYSNDPCWSPRIRIRLYDPATGTRQTLQGSDGRSENQGNVSLDGQWYVYGKADQSYYAPHRIYVMDSSGSETRITYASGTDDGTPHFSPDGARVAFSRRPLGGNWSLWIVNRDGTGETVLLQDQFSNLAPDWAVVPVQND